MSRVHLECKVWVGPLGNRKPAMVLGCEVVDPERFGDPVLLKHNVPENAPRSRNPGEVTCRACRRSMAMWRVRHGAWHDEVIAGWYALAQSKRAFRRMINRGHRKHAWGIAKAKRRGIVVADKPEAAQAQPVDMHRTRPARANGCPCKRCQRKSARRASQGAEGKAA